MPLLKLQTSPAVGESCRTQILKECSRLLAEATGKPEKYVMVVLEEGSFLMAGQEGPAAFADVRGIGGLSRTVNEKVTARLCAFLGEELKIAPERVYVTFTDVPATNWGCNGGTFG